MILSADARSIVSTVRLRSPRCRIDHLRKGIQTIDTSCEFTQRVKVFDEDRQRIENCGECAGGLHDATNFDLAREHNRRENDAGTTYVA